MSKPANDTNGRIRWQLLYWIDADKWRSPNMFLCLATIRALASSAKPNAWVRLVNERTSKMADIRMVTKISTGWQELFARLPTPRLYRRVKKYFQIESRTNVMARALILDRYIANDGCTQYLPSFHTMLSRTYDIKRYGLCHEQLEEMLWIQSRMDSSAELSVVMCKDRALRRRHLKERTNVGKPYPKHPGSAYCSLDRLLETNAMWGEQSETPLLPAETFTAMMIDVMAVVPPMSRRRFIKWFAAKAGNQNYRCSDNTALVARCRQILKTQIKNKTLEELERECKL